MATPLGQALQIIAPRKRQARGGVAETNTIGGAAGDGTLTAPSYNQHIQDLLTNRQAQDSRTLLNNLFVHDPDLSAAVNAYLTVANTKPQVLAYDLEGNLDRDGMEMANQLLRRITSTTDHTLGFQLKPSLEELCADLRYMALLRGGIGVELVFDKKFVPTEMRNVDLSTISWREQNPGQYKPFQEPQGGGDEISLDIPTFFVAFHRRNPTNIYTFSTFVAAINTIAARQQIINDLYRIMQLTGFPRIDITVMEEVLVKNAPADVKANDNDLREWIRNRLSDVRNTFSTLRADQAFIHMDSVETGVMNDRNPGAALDISAVIDTLNAQNQAGMKTMATILGRGESGVNTASTEARIFSMNADEVNQPIASVLSKALSFGAQIYGFQGFIDVKFPKAELRPETELEAQLTMRATRLKEDLSLGLIGDDEYHMKLYGRPRPNDAPELSGTGFAAPAIGVDAEGVSPNSDPLGRSVSSKTDKQARSN